MRGCKSIGRRLRKTREALGLSQAEFCRQIGVQRNLYNPFEKGRRRITIDVVPRRRLFEGRNFLGIGKPSAISLNSRGNEQAASRKNSAALSASPMQASEVISRTPFNPRSLRLLEERAPARLILLRPLANAENLPITALVHADCNQQRDVAHLAGPAALEHDAVEINIRVVARDRTIAPRLDRPAGIATRGAALIACALHSRSASACGKAFNVSVPRTTRSRWLLIRSSSIVMTLFSGLGVSSDMAAPSRWPESQKRGVGRFHL